MTLEDIFEEYSIDIIEEVKTNVNYQWIGIVNRRGFLCLSRTAAIRKVLRYIEKEIPEDESDLLTTEHSSRTFAVFISHLTDTFSIEI